MREYLSVYPDNLQGADVRALYGTSIIDHAITSVWDRKTRKSLVLDLGKNFLADKASYLLAGLGGCVASIGAQEGDKTKFSIGVTIAIAAFLTRPRR